MTVRITAESFDPAAEIAAFEARAAGAGGVVTFCGKVRPQAEGAPVEALFIDHYPGVTERGIARRIEEARARWRIEECLVIHRVGEIPALAPIVLVCAAAAHRRDAFEAVDSLMDFLKTEAMFWKKERRNGASEWIEPRAEDYRDAARWRERNEWRA